MPDLDGLIRNIKGFDLYAALEQIFNGSNVKKHIIDLNQEQLYEKGIDARGVILRTYKANYGNVYSAYTIMRKRKAGHKTDVVTLRETGDFYKTFSVTIDKEGIEINADFRKPGGNISDNVDIDNVLGLTKENMERISRSSLIVLIEIILKELLK